MRDFESLEVASNKVVVIVDAKSDIINLGRISNEIGSDIKGIKLGAELFQFDRPWSIHRLIKDRGVSSWLDVNYMLDAKQISQATKGAYDKGVERISISPLSGVDSLISASSVSSNDNNIFIPMPNFHDNLVIPFLEDVLTANESLPYRKQITDIMCNVGLIETVKNMGNFTVIATGIRYDGQPIDDHPAVMTPKEAIQAGADILAIGKLITKYSNSGYQATLERVADEIQDLT